jgi:tRNA threonylcarbamoyladenosine biosynthesis protein TsaB
VLTLAIETSGLVGSLALLDGETCLEERTLELGRQHGQSLIPEMKRLLTDLGRTPRDCELLAVSTGPGSFTGLRVGVVCAKTWGYATGCRVVGVDTHLAIAGNTPAGIRRVQIVSDAQRGDLFFSTFVRNADGNWETADALDYRPVAAWIDGLTAEEAVSGPGVAKLVEQIQERCHLLEPSHWRPRAAEVGRIGVELARGGHLSDLWTLEPLYVRRSSAEEKWDLRPRR